VDRQLIVPLGTEAGVLEVLNVRLPPTLEPLASMTGPLPQDPQSGRHVAFFIYLDLPLVAWSLIFPLLGPPGFTPAPAHVGKMAPPRFPRPDFPPEGFQAVVTMIPAAVPRPNDGGLVPDLALAGASVLKKPLLQPDLPPEIFEPDGPMAPADGPRPNDEGLDPDFPSAGTPVLNKPLP